MFKNQYFPHGKTPSFPLNVIRSSLFTDVSKDLRWPIVAHDALRTSTSEAVVVCALISLG